MSGKGGLAFLNKKSWHTGTIANAEKVWLAEQAADAERNKVQQLQKEIEEERQVEELKALQRQHGLTPAGESGVQRVDWMYRSVEMELEKKDKEKEEYLLGKVVDGSNSAAPTPVSTNETRHGSEGPGTARWVQKYENRDLDAEARIREDPMLVILQKEREARLDVVKNPLRMKKIRQEVKLVKKLKKLEKQERKRKRKEEKKRTKRTANGAVAADIVDGAQQQVVDDADSTGLASNGPTDRYGLIVPRPAAETDARRRSRSRSRSRPPPTSRRRHSRSPSRSRSRRRLSRVKSRRAFSRSPPRRSRSRSRRRHRSRSRSRRRLSRVQSRRSFSRSPPRRSRSRSHRRHRSGSRSPRRYHRQRSPHRRSPSPSPPPPPPPRADRARVEDAVSRRRPRKQVRRVRDVASSNTSKLTAEERQAKLQAMMSDANFQHNIRKEQLIADEKKQQEEEHALRHQDDTAAQKAAFIQDMNKKAFLNSGDALEDRISQRKHYRQKGAVDEHSFI